MIINKLLENGYIPDSIIRTKIRNLLKLRIDEETYKSLESEQDHLMQMIKELQQSPIAIETNAANEQHYEVPAAFFQLVLGQHLKYSSGYWNNNCISLNEAEQAALKITADHAQIEDGMHILELGCGWGSLTLYLARMFPKCRIVAVSNSKTQKEYIDKKCKQEHLHQVEVITEDMNQFEIHQKFDRVVSVEMFEHMRNYKLLLKKINRFLKPDGKLFVHIFTNKSFTYYFEVKDANDWMSKYFFTGGIMPSDDLLFYFNEDLVIENHWNWDGTHYEKTANKWLHNMDAHKKEIIQLFSQTYGEQSKMKWWNYWRIFFMACAELWGYKNGREWFVSHYLFSKRLI